MSKVLDEFLLDKAVIMLSNWRKQLPKYNIPVAVNLSPNQFQSLDLVSRIRELLTRHDVPGDLLELEITENVAMEDIEKGMDTIRLLQEMGVKVSIDDFGTGYSSLAYLRKIPIDKIKIDRSFISEMQINDSDYTIVHSMIKLAHGLGKRVLAEGVEISDQLDLLGKMGCDSIQGYFFYKPLPEEDTLALIVKSM
jgi:EAL domain-containing protein (putative c-di-GMP-specific phosphodiesterase class I)